VRFWLRDTWRCFVPLRFDAVREGYDRAYAERMDRFAQSESWIRDQDAMIDGLALGPASRVLDFGCNTGRLTARLQERAGCDVHGVDHNPEALAIARSAHPAARFDICDGGRLPYPDGFFDAAVMSHVIGHLPSPAATLAEIRRVLRPGGLLGVLTPNRWFKVFMILPNLINGYRPDPTVLRFYSRARLKRMLERAELRVVLQSYVGEMPTGGGFTNCAALRARLMVIAKREGEG